LKIVLFGNPIKNQKKKIKSQKQLKKKKKEIYTAQIQRETMLKV
jgi:hypothetical protein